MSVKERLEETDRLKDHWCIPPEDVQALLSLIEAVEQMFPYPLYGAIPKTERVRQALKAVTE